MSFNARENRMNTVRLFAEERLLTGAESWWKSEAVSSKAVHTQAATHSRRPPDFQPPHLQCQLPSLVQVQRPHPPQWWLQESRSDYRPERQVRRGDVRPGSCLPHVSFIRHTSPPHPQPFLPHSIHSSSSSSFSCVGLLTMSHHTSECNEWHS